MQAHRSKCLTGPISKSRVWWQTVTLRNNNKSDNPMNREAPADNDESEIRADLVARVRRQIAEGVYDTPERWEKALDRLQERLEQA